MNELIIRSATINDAKEMAHTEILCFSDPWSQDAFEKELTENHLAMYMVAEVAGKAIGHAGVWIVVDQGHITNVAVRPAFRRQKIGERLLKRMLEDSITKGVMEHTLEVRASNQSAIQLYEKFGFRSVNVRKRYYEDNGEDAIIMNRVHKNKS